MKLKRIEAEYILQFMPEIPVVAIIGARQVGKTTLAKLLLPPDKEAVFLDLEKHSDRQMIAQTERFLNLNKDKVMVIDEVQMMPEIFGEIRSFVDNNPEARLVVLGSSSPELSRQTSESLAGRIYYFELSPFLWPEIQSTKWADWDKYRFRGGMPLSLMASSDRSATMWLNNYIRTFLERDLKNFGFNIPPDTLRRLWQMLAHLNGQMLNSSQLGNAMGLSHTTIKNYIDILAHTFMLRLIPPYYVNVKKRLVKTPKVYFRDTGVLHAMLDIPNYEALFAHPVFGSSWEVTVIENVIAKFRGWNYYFYRTATGNELDLVLTKGLRIVAIEIKSSDVPKVTKGFWQAIDDIKATEAYVIAPVRMPFPINEHVMVYPLESFLELKVDE